MSEDITGILKSWEYDPEHPTRIIKADDGRDVLQVRQPLGIEQYELDGRPDGERPEGKECLVDIYLAEIERYREEHGTNEGYVLTHDDFTRLQNEGIIYYYRYLILFQMGDFERTASDTDHNLKICDMVEKYVIDENDRRELLQYKPYILRINAIAKAMISLNQQLKGVATQTLESAIEIIQKMPNVETPAFKFEKLRSLHSLRTTLKQIIGQKSSPLDSLKEELRKAVDTENYERAAELRDRIEELEEQEQLHDDGD